VTRSELCGKSSRRARCGQIPPILLIAQTQSAGRGRVGRPWHTNAWQGSGVVPALTFSLGLPLVPKRSWSGLSLAVGVSVAESLQPLLPDASSEQRRIVLKWPNDLWLDDDRKLGGILVETASTQAHGPSPERYVIVGIGLNILPPQPPDGASIHPACLHAIDSRWSADTALECIAAPLVQTLKGFAEHGFAPFQARFARRDALAARAVTLSNGVRGTAYGVAEDGALLVLTDSGMQAITSAEISVRPISVNKS